MSTHLIIGDDAYMVNKKAKEIIAAHLPPEEQALALETVAGECPGAEAARKSVRACIEAVRTVSFLGNGRKVVWLRNVTFLGDDGVSRSDGAKAAVEQLAELIDGGFPPEHTLVITAPAVGAKSVLLRTCKSKAEVLLFSIPEKAYQAEKNAKQFALETLAKDSIGMDNAALDHLINVVGTETGQIASELQKLAIFLSDRKHATVHDIDAVCSPLKTVKAWDMADAVAERNLTRSLAVLRQCLLQDENAIAVVIMLGNRIRDLMLYREALENGWLSLRDTGQFPSIHWNELPAEVETEFTENMSSDPRRVHPFRAAKLAVQAKRSSMAELRRWQGLLTETHEKLVSTGIPDSLLLYLLLVRLLVPHADTK